VQDYFLPDIEQIEVVRGPGAALWGSNAVNGVINIISKHSRDTQGLYAEAGAGDEQKIIAGARYGLPIGERGWMRVYGKYSERDATYHPGAQSDDDWNIGHVGLRADWEMSDADDVMLSAAAYDGEIGLVVPSIEVIGRPGPVGELRADVQGGHILGQWTRRVDEDTRWRTRLYYDRTRRDDPSYLDELDTIDFDVQYGTRLGTRHDVLVGLNYRQMDNRNIGGGIFALQPPSSKDEVFSGFVQDQIALNESVRLTIGTKLEENDFSGFELQPSIRLAWDAHSAMMLWGSISRAARVPTRLERDVEVDALDPTSNPRAILIGNEDLDSEEVIGYEAGLRWQPTETFFGDLAVFYNDYDGLMSLEFDEAYIDSTDGRVIIPIRNQNLTNGHSHGLEALATYAPVSWWRLTGSYAFLDLTLDPRGQDVNRGEFYEGATPRHQVGVRSQIDFAQNVTLDLEYRYNSDIDRMPEDPTGAGIDAYSELDLRVAWRARENIELALVGQNLLHARHAEIGSARSRGAIERSVYAKVTWGW
jgi:iron complex outermembrane recepter protein